MVLEFSLRIDTGGVSQCLWICGIGGAAAAATKRSVFSAMGETTAVGKVSGASVRLQRVIPMVGNSFKPFFIGRFEMRDGKVVLAGRFTMLAIAKVFMTFWFGVVVVFAGAVLLGSFRPEGGNGWLFLLQPFVMFGGGLAVVAAGKWFARNDTAWLSGVIEGALTLPAAGGPVSRSAQSGADEGAVPLTLKGMAIFLAASGVMAVASGLAMTGLPPRSMPGSAAPPIPTLGRWSFVYAGLVIALAMGVWRRRTLAWQGVFVLLVSSGCWSIYAMYAMSASESVGPPVVIRVIFAVLSCAVVAVWGRWWYAQRKHFRWN
jgi:hypothetical protein